MIRFDFLGDLKEVESTEHHIESYNTINKTLERQVNHSEILSLCPTVVLDLLGHSCSHAMGKRATET